MSKLIPSVIVFSSWEDYLTKLNYRNCQFALPFMEEQRRLVTIVAECNNS